MSLEFSYYELGDIADIKGGKRLPKGHTLTSIKNKHPYIKVKDMVPSKLLKLNDNFEYIEEDTYNKISNYIVNEGDLIISIVGTIGLTNIIDSSLNLANLTENCAKITNPKKDFNLSYIYYFFNSENGLNLINGSTVGAVQKKLPIKNIRSMKIPLPDISTQNKIVKLLSNIDEKIAINQEINHNLISQIEAIYYSWFVYYDDYSIEELEECEIGLKPKEWDLLSLGEVTTKIKDKVGKNNYKVFSAVNTGNLQLSEEYFDKQVFSKDIGKYIIVKQKEFAYNPARINIGSIGRNDFNFDGCVSPVYVAFKVEKGYENFMNLFIKSSRFNQWVNTLSSESVRQTLNYEDFSIIKIAYPPLELVKKFNAIYESYYELIHYNEILIEKLENIRDILLPKLMSGEIDISKVNCDLKLIIKKFILKIINYLEDLI